MNVIAAKWLNLSDYQVHVYKFTTNLFGLIYNDDPFCCPNCLSHVVNANFLLVTLY